MQLTISNKTRISTFSYASYALIGILTAAASYSTGMKYLGVYGIFVNTIFLIVISYFGIRNTHKKTRTRMIILGIIGMTALFFAIYIGFCITIWTL